MQDTLQIAGIAAQSAGLLVLFLHWRAKRGLGAVTLVLGWTLVALSAIPWLLSVSPERGLAIAMLAPMASGLLLLAPDGLSRLGNGAKPKKERGVDPATALEPETATQGRLSRNVARWIGSVIAAPALALAAAAAWQAFVPGAIADRVAFSILVLMIVWTAALLWLLSTMRPWIAAALITIAAFGLGAGAHAFVTGGAA